MKGTVTRPVMAGDAGEIRGDDGKTYVFTLAQVRHNAVPQPGERVDFIGLGEDARDIHVEEKPDAVPPAAPPRTSRWRRCATPATSSARARSTAS